MKQSISFVAMILILSLQAGTKGGPGKNPPPDPHSPPQPPPYNNLYLQSLALQGMSPLDLLRRMPPEMPTKPGEEGMQPRDEESSYWDLYDDVEGI